MIVMAEFELSSVEKAVKGHLPKALELSRSLRRSEERRVGKECRL